MIANSFAEQRRPSISTHIADSFIDLKRLVFSSPLLLCGPSDDLSAAAHFWFEIAATDIVIFGQEIRSPYDLSPLRGLNGQVNFMYLY